MRIEDCKVGMLVRLRGLNSTWRISKFLSSKSFMEITNLVNGEVRPVVWTTIQPIDYQPEIGPILRVTAPQAHAYDIGDLRRNDPSKGAATLYATIPTCPDRYHRVADGEVQYWYTQEGLPGYWRTYRVQAIGRFAIKNAIELTPPKVNYRPTLQDYERGEANTRARHARLTARIVKQVAELTAAQSALNKRTEYKLTRVHNLKVASQWNRKDGHIV